MRCTRVNTSVAAARDAPRCGLAGKSSTAGQGLCGQGVRRAGRQRMAVSGDLAAQAMITFASRAPVSEHVSAARRHGKSRSVRLLERARASMWRPTLVDFQKTCVLGRICRWTRLPPTAFNPEGIAQQTSASFHEHKTASTAGCWTFSRQNTARGMAAQEWCDHARRGLRAVEEEGER